MKKAIFLDRDGTINVEKDYIYKSEDLVFEEGSIEALKTFKNLGYILIVVSNQSGIARGYFTEEDLNIFNNNIIPSSISLFVKLAYPKRKDEVSLWISSK